MMNAEIDASRNFTGWVSELARTHTASLARVAAGEGLTQEDALDAVQEAFHTFLGLPQARSLVGEESESRALMSVIVRNKARNMRRRHHRAAPHVDVENERQLTSAEKTVEELLSDAEQHVQLLGCVNQLADIQRNVVSLRMFEEASTKEVSTLLELTPSNVAVLLHRAKEELARCMSS